MRVFRRRESDADFVSSGEGSLRLGNSDPKLVFGATEDLSVSRFLIFWLASRSTVEVANNSARSCVNCLTTSSWVFWLAAKAALTVSNSDKRPRTTFSFSAKAISAFRASVQSLLRFSACSLASFCFRNLAAFRAALAATFFAIRRAFKSREFFLPFF